MRFNTTFIEQRLEGEGSKRRRQDGDVTDENTE